MNGIDIALALILGYALYKGFCAGLIVELSGILGLIIGTYLAYTFSDRAAVWFDLPGGVSRQVAFVVIPIGVLIVISIIGKMVSKMIDLAGLGVPNKLLGAVASLVKTTLIVSILLTALSAINTTTGWLKPNTIAQSKLYKPIEQLSAVIFPYLNFETIEQFYKQNVEPSLKEPNEAPATRQNALEVCPDTMEVVPAGPEPEVIKGLKPL